MLAALILVLFADAPKVDKAELKRLQGKWSVMAHEHGGMKTPAKELASLVLEVKGAQMITHEGDKLKEGTSIIALDPKAKPAATLDLKVDTSDDAGKLVKAIWKRSGDTLTICVAEPGKDRPTEFEGKKDSGHTLMVFKKAAK
jgi:uncharacterized protein (TIGR03067 family)